MDSKILIPVFLCILMLSVSAKDGDPCSSATDCDTGEWCEAARCKYYPCSSNADCPECGVCAGGVCYRDGGCVPGGNIGTVIPIEPIPNPADIIIPGVDPSDLIAPGGMVEAQPLDPGNSEAMPPDVREMDMTPIYIGAIIVLIIIVAILFMKKK